MGHDVSRLGGRQPVGRCVDANPIARPKQSRVLQMPEAPTPKAHSTPSSTRASSSNGVVGIRGATRGALGGIRALKAATGLEGFVSPKDLRRLREVRAKQASLAGESLPALAARFGRLRGIVDGDHDKIDRVTVEALAIANVVAERTLGQPPRDEQVIAAIAMARGSAVELATGEGKTLAVGLAASALALTGEGVHVMTANHYLADRDSKNLAPMFDALELSVGLVADDFSSSRYDDKRDAYRADITYGNVATMAFDWLEDQTWWRKEARVMRGLPTALVDELDHILLDTALEPLVLSRFPSPGEETEIDAHVLEQAKLVVDRLEERDVVVYLEGDSPKPILTDSGLAKMEAAVRDVLGLPDGASVWEEAHLAILAELRVAMEARFAVRPGRDYIRTKDDIVLVSQATGRPNPAARLRHGLHNAVRVREGLPPEPNAIPIAMGSYHHFLSAYGHLAGTTATANGAAEELRDLHQLSITRIPTHRESKRTDLPDRIFAHPTLRDAAAIADLIRRNERGQPVLISTVSVEASKRMANLVRDPILAIAHAACSSSALLAVAAERVEDADELLGRPEARGDDRRRASLADSLAERMREDPEGARAFVAFLADQGLDLSPLLARPEGLAPRVLNAENHAEEAGIIESAGQGGAVIIATQMAGRGVHIDVPDAVLELGGLHVIGIERKDSERLDLQLVGRSGRCGEIGSSQFYLSPADAFLTHLSAADRRALGERLSGDRPELTSTLRRFLFSRAVKSAQQHAQMRAASQRYTTVPLDESLEFQRKAVQKFRDETIEHADPLELILGWIGEWAAVEPDEVRELFGLDASDRDVVAAIRARVAAHDAKAGVGAEDSADFLRDMILYHVDDAWLGQLHEHELLRNTAFMRTRLNTWADHTFDTSVEFLKMCQAMQETIVDRLAFHLAN